MISDIFTAPDVIASQHAPRVNNFRYRLINPETGKSESWSRVTTFAKTLADTSALHAWEIRMILKGLAENPSMLSGVSSWDVSEHKMAFAEIAARAKAAAGGNEGAQRGTRMHDLTEQWDRNQPIAHATGAERTDVLAYHSAIEQAGITILPQYIERYVAIPELKLCGKFDRIFEWLDPRDNLKKLVIGDVKTAKNVFYSWLEIAIQLALYAMASHYWDDAADAWVRMPYVDQESALVMHIPVGTGLCDIHRVPLVSGREAIDATAEARRLRAAASRKGFTDPLWVAAEHLDSHDRYALRISLAKSVEDLSAAWRDATAEGCWTPELQALGRARQAELSR